MSQGTLNEQPVTTTADGVIKDFSNRIINLEEFADIDLSNADFRGATLSYVTFTNVRLCGARLDGVDLSSCNLTNVDLQNANLTGTIFHFPKNGEKEVHNADFSHSTVYRYRNERFDECGFGTLSHLYKSKYERDARGFDFYRKLKNGSKYDGRGFDVRFKHRNGTSFDPQGYDCYGYDRNGFNANHMHKNGTPFDEYGYSTTGYDCYGYDRSGFNANHMHKNGTPYSDRGYDYQGRSRSGFDEDGYDTKGINSRGFDRGQQHRNGTGRDDQGFDFFGQSRDGRTMEQFSNGYDARGYDAKGYDRDGFNEIGLDRNGRNRSGVKLNVLRVVNRLLSTHGPANQVSRELKPGEINSADYLIAIGLTKDLSSQIPISAWRGYVYVDRVVTPPTSSWEVALYEMDFFLFYDENTPGFDQFTNVIYFPGEKSRAYISGEGLGGFYRVLPYQP